MKRLLAAAVLAAAPAAAQGPAPVTPASIVAGAPKSEWRPIDPADLLVMSLAPDAAGNPRTVVIQLIPPPFSQGWVGNIRMLAKAHWWDGTSVYRVVDNWVTQWGDGEDDPKKAEPLPQGMQSPAGATGAYEIAVSGAVLPTTWTNTGWHAFKDTFGPSLSPAPSNFFGVADPYAAACAFKGGFPVALGFPPRTVSSAAPLHPTVRWPIHCYGAVGVARDTETTGTGAELYAVIGTPPRQLDRNIAVVGRVIEGIENLSALPRGKGEMGVYDDPRLRLPILSVRLGSEVRDPPHFEYLDTESASFRRYLEVSANRSDPFYKVSAGGIDICNAKVPIRRSTGSP